MKAKVARTTLWARAIDRALSVIYPPRCIGVDCGQRGTWLCADCLATALPVPDTVCVRCGVRTGEPRTCARCRRTPPAYDRVLSAGRHETILRRAIHALKYGGHRSLAPPLGEFVAERCPFVSGGEIVVPVPSRRRRIALRGIDHAMLIALAFAMRADCHLHTAALCRVRSTRPQVGLEPELRSTNVAGAFVATCAVRARNVILVDDVLTTGATANECAAALRAAGASSVVVCTVARAAVRPERHRSRVTATRA